MKWIWLLSLVGGLHAADGLYFPGAGEWARITPAEVGWNADALNEALDVAGARRSSSMVVLYRGKILAEKNWRNPVTPEDVASVQKSITSVLIGIAQEKKLLRLDDAVAKYLGQSWSKAGEKETAITIRHLLTMTSGLSDALEVEAAAGTKWRYNTVAYQKLPRLLGKASGKSINELSKEWLFEPLGMSDSKWVERAAMPGLLGLMTTARDMARFGLMVQADGKWNGKPIVSASYLREALDTSQPLNRSYGYLWWLNGRPTVRPNGKQANQLIPGASKDLVAALGALGRKIYVVPSLELVVTRTGANSDADGEPPFDEVLWKALMKASPRTRQSAQ